MHPANFKEIFMDFFNIRERCPKRGEIDIYPDFKIGKWKDLMIRGKAFYSIWDEKKCRWSTDEYDVARIIDEELNKYYEDNRSRFEMSHVDIKYMSSYGSNSWKAWKQYLKDSPDNYKQLDNKVIFSNTDVKKEDYCSKQLSYPLKKGSTKAYDEMMSVLYEPEERQKIEWAIGAIISGDAKKIQKFLVFYGEPGTGKSTVLEIIQQMFPGYYSIFEAKALVSSNNTFALEQFKSNPLIAIQHDGDLSKIEDNSKLNSVISHEEIVVNEKFKAQYSMRSNCFMFMATNKAVKITDAKAGLIRRLIDVRPTGRRIEADRFYELRDQIEFELSGIAFKCLDIYQKLGKDYYNKYRPTDMMYKTDPFFNFVEDHYILFENQDGISLKQAYNLYKEYCNETNASYTLQMYVFREELKNYFKKFDDLKKIDGVQIRSYYSGFLTDKFDRTFDATVKKEIADTGWIDLKKQYSLLDDICGEMQAQPAKDGKPTCKWDNCTTLLKDIKPWEVHYVKINDIHHIVIDFDLKDENGEKSLELNMQAANKFPKTYVETSQSGKGLHLHYIYDGNPEELSRVYDEDIEIKVFTGNSSLRRKLILCNDIPIAHISSGLPLKEKKGDKMDFNQIKSERGLRSMIKRNLNKEIHPGTKPSVDFIFKIVEDYYMAGNNYDISDMEPAIIAFAGQSSNHADYCLKLVTKMHFKSDDISEPTIEEENPIAFYDVEVFPNLFLVNWKYEGEGKTVVRMINPSSNEIEDLVSKVRLVGFNCRRYDNHIMYARMMGYSNIQLYSLSQRIINSGKKGITENCFFGEAYNMSYTDIYDYSAKKQSLKKWEIELGIHHQELGLPWDKPVDESLWEKVAEYCDNDVLATEAVWNATQADFVSRKILASLAGGTVNDTTNSLTTKIIFKSNRRPQSQFCYRNLAEPVMNLDEDVYDFLKETFPEMMSQKHGKAKSLLPYFEGYEFRNGVSTYKGYEVGEGGFVWANPGLYLEPIVTDDVASMHPHSAMAECLFGPEYTRAFRDIVHGRVGIKHEAWNTIDKMLDGKLKPFIEDCKKGLISSKQLANALKIAINSVYGLTAAKFENPFRDPRNIDNIVAKRGALFMIDLKEEVEKRGGIVVHIKTDSIKLLNPTNDIQEFVMKFGKKYGYTFEIEHKFEKFCLVNNAVYVAKLATDDEDWISDAKKAESKGLPEPTRWTATGAEFQHPYIFKTMFTHEPIEFEDYCETKEVTGGSLYLDMNESLSDVSMYEKELADRVKYDISYKNPTLQSCTDEELKHLIDEGHEYKFVGRVGNFVPIISGRGGGELLREKDGKYSAATGTKGYRWLESEIVKTLGKEDDIDISYYRNLVNESIEHISEFGDYEQFVS